LLPREKIKVTLGKFVAKEKHGKLHNPSSRLVPLSPLVSLGLWFSEKNIMGRSAC
jgi:hypothetical protein